MNNLWNEENNKNIEIEGEINLKVWNLKYLKWKKFDDNKELNFVFV